MTTRFHQGQRSESRSTISITTRQYGRTHTSSNQNAFRQIMRGNTTILLLCHFLQDQGIERYIKDLTMINQVVSRNEHIYMCIKDLTVTDIYRFKCNFCISGVISISAVPHFWKCGTYLFFYMLASLSVCSSAG